MLAGKLRDTPLVIHSARIVNSPRKSRAHATKKLIGRKRNFVLTHQRPFVKLKWLTIPFGF
jgi:hypothetical protein